MREGMPIIVEVNHTECEDGSLSSIESCSPLKFATTRKRKPTTRPPSQVADSWRDTQVIKEEEEEGDSSEDSEIVYAGKIAPISPITDDFEHRHTEKAPLLPKVEEEEDDALSSSTHAQSLVLGLAFAAIWSPQNVMAPNLTQIANFFHFSASQRDVLLGANISFATGVLSLPVSAIIGVLADIVNRKYLYALVVFIGGVSSIATGLCTTYTQLYFCRFVCGGCMAGCTPVAFSLLGDFFHTKDRNAASSGLTAMMGAGIIIGQVFAGMAGPAYGWEFPFYCCGVWCILGSLAVVSCVQEPIRGGKEKVLQDIINSGNKYDRKLTWKGFWHSIRHNPSNCLLILQGFFSSVPWGIIFCFLNDYLSQEQGLSVPDATFLVLVFGVGCGMGGLLGGWVGQITTRRRREFMPLSMAISTFLGIFPFVALLNDQDFHTASLKACMYAISSGMIASTPSVNVRPAIINVNPPEIRGATLTAANLIINLARGIGPVFLTSVCAIWGVSRRFSFNVLLISFWVVTTIQLLMLVFYYPQDQDKMEQELARYANSFTRQTSSEHSDRSSERSSERSIERGIVSIADDETIISIEERSMTFDAEAMRESLSFFGESFKEIGHFGHHDGSLRHRLVLPSDKEYSSFKEMRRSSEEKKNVHWKDHKLLGESITLDFDAEQNPPTEIDDIAKASLSFGSENGDVI